MGNRSPRTHQRSQYERAYQDADSEYGFPDRKIVDGRTLRGKQVLSLGCGTGNDVWYLVAENLVVGLDYAVSGLEVGSRHGVRGVVGDLNLRPVLPFRAQSFGVVICKDILEHVLGPLVVLQEVRRVLKDDGYVVISVPNHFYLPLRLRILFGKGLIWKCIGSDHGREYEEWDYMHIRFFTYMGFRRFLKVAGFRAEKWFWDFGNLAHYHNPDMWLEPQLWKKAHGRPISRRGKMGLYVLRPVYRLFNLVFPPRLRSWIVGLAPGLLCTSFYVRCVPQPAPAQEAS
jgi:SAM-dependent methyltransferase